MYNNKYLNILFDEIIIKRFNKKGNETNHCLFLISTNDYAL